MREALGTKIERRAKGALARSSMNVIWYVCMVVTRYEITQAGVPVTYRASGASDGGRFSGLYPNGIDATDYTIRSSSHEA